MKIVVFSATKQDRQLLVAAHHGHDHERVGSAWQPEPDAAWLAARFSAACVFANDESTQKIVVTDHQVFFVRTTIGSIGARTPTSIRNFASGRSLANEARCGRARNQRGHRKLLPG